MKALALAGGGLSIARSVSGSDGNMEMDAVADDPFINAIMQRYSAQPSTSDILNVLAQRQQAQPSLAEVLARYAGPAAGMWRNAERYWGEGNAQKQSDLARILGVSPDAIGFGLMGTARAGGPRLIPALRVKGETFTGEAGGHVAAYHKIVDKYGEGVAAGPDVLDGFLNPDTGEFLNRQDAQKLMSQDKTSVGLMSSDLPKSGSQ